MSEASDLFDDGNAYERLMGRWSRLVGEKFLDWIAPEKYLRWIDVGCGNGAFTEVLIERCSPVAVAGVDPSEAQLAFARTRPGAKLAQFRIADAQSLPFADAAFDAASMALAITFIPDAQKAVKEMARVVKPGGVIGTYMWDFENRGIPLAPLGVAMKSLGIVLPNAPYVDNSRRDNMQTMWERAELMAVETDVIPIDVAYESFDDFWHSNTLPVGPAGKVIADLTIQDREELKARVREELPVAPDGSIAYRSSANAVKGKVRP
jgi:ubiquinone/menaquinone biosynthesis C-methylase UbiE